MYMHYECVYRIPLKLGLWMLVKLHVDAWLSIPSPLQEQ